MKKYTAMIHRGIQPAHEWSFVGTRQGFIDECVTCGYSIIGEIREEVIECRGKDNVLAFPASTTMTPEQALLSALEFAKSDNLQDVLIVGYDGDGELLVRSSRMDRKDALWLSEQLRKYALNDIIRYNYATD